MSQTSEMRRILLHALSNVRTVQAKPYSDHYTSQRTRQDHIDDLNTQTAYLAAAVEMVAACMGEDEEPDAAQPARDDHGRFAKGAS